MGTLVFDVSAFRAQFPAFSNADVFDDATLQAYWDAAICYISNENYGYLAGDCRQRAINLMVAHLLQLARTAAAGKQSGLMQSASIDKISITVTPPPVQSQWQWWLSTTPYGAQLLALLQSKSVGGFYIGGLPETAAFRKAWGRF